MGGVVRGAQEVGRVGFGGVDREKEMIGRCALTGAEQSACGSFPFISFEQEWYDRGGARTHLFRR